MFTVGADIANADISESSGETPTRTKDEAKEQSSGRDNDSASDLTCREDATAATADGDSGDTGPAADCVARKDDDNEVDDNGDERDISADTTAAAAAAAAAGNDDDDDDDDDEQVNIMQQHFTLFIYFIYYATNAAHKIHTTTTTKSKNRNRRVPNITHKRTQYSRMPITSDDKQT